jgi:hypothetical protein
MEANKRSIVRSKTNYYNIRIGAAWVAFAACGFRKRDAIGLKITYLVARSHQQQPKKKA